jgi:hypothetical protein
MKIDRIAHPFGLTIVIVIAMAAMRLILGIASEEQAKEQRELSSR